MFYGKEVFKKSEILWFNEKNLYNNIYFTDFFRIFFIQIWENKKLI